jgi:hypothetical protein
MVMKVINLLALVPTFFSRVSSLLPSQQKICRDCIHFIGDTNECRLFKDTNIITGELTYPHASQIRADSEKCGVEAIYFEENNAKIITEPYFFVKKNWRILLSCGLLYEYVRLLTYQYYMDKP